MRIVPVIDVKNGVVVRAIGGRRNEYRPLITPLTTDISPLAVARAMSRAVGSNTIYFADLDSITSERDNLEHLLTLSEAGFEVWADTGIFTMSQLRHFQPGDAVIPVIGSETLRHLTTLQHAVDEFGPRGVMVSVDLQNGGLLGRWDSWGFQRCPDAIEFVYAAYHRGVRRFIVLDLISVGEGRGVPTRELCRELKVRYPDIELVTGGGIRNRDDAENLSRDGVDAVLVSTAIHEM